MSPPRNAARIVARVSWVALGLEIVARKRLARPVEVGSSRPCSAAARTGAWASRARRRRHALDEHLDDPDVLVVNSPEVVRRQAVPLGAGAKDAIVVLLAMIILLATGVVPAVIAGLLAACAMVLPGVLSVDRAYRSIDWTTVRIRNFSASRRCSTRATGGKAAGDCHRPLG